MSETVIGAGQVLEPNKKTFTNYRAPVLSYELREAMVGVLNPGCYCGFDTIKATEIRENVYAITISHEKTGVVKTVYLTQEQGGGAGVSMPTGLFVTRFGTIVHDSLPIDIAEVNLPIDGLYLLYAEYDRPTVGTTENNVVGDIRYDVVKIDQDSEDEYFMSGSGDTLNFRNEILNMIQTPVAIIRKDSNKEEDKITIESGKFGAEWLKPGSGYTPLSGIDIHRENNTDWGKLTLQDLETSLGCFGVGRFKYLGRTLYSLWDLINKQFRWDDIDTEVVKRVVAKIGGGFNPLADENGRFNGNDKFGNNGVLYELPNHPFEYRGELYESVYIKVQSIWDNLMTLDAEAQELWAQMGYRDNEPYNSELKDDRTQPETEKIILAEKTIWENLYKIRHYINTEDDKIWTRLGLSRNSSEDGGIPDKPWGPSGKNLIDKATTVWNNLSSLAEFLYNLDKFVHEDKRQPEGEGGVVSNIKALWAQLGYDKDNDSDNPGEPYYKSGMSVNKTIWDNLTTLYSHQKKEIENVENRLKQANDFIIVTKKAKLGKGSYGENNTIRPGAFTPDGSITPSGYDNPKTYLYVIDEEEPSPSETEFTDHYINFGQPQLGDIANSRVAFIIFRPRSAWSRLIFDGAFNSQSSRFENVKFYLSSGGIAMMYKMGYKDNNPVKWEVHLINPGTGGSGGSGSVAGGGLMADTEQVNYKSTDNPTPLGSVSIPNAGYCRVSSTKGISEINVDTFIEGVDIPITWGAGGTVYIALDRPTDDQVDQGSEKIIKLIGDSLLTARGGSTIRGWGNPNIIIRDTLGAGKNSTGYEFIKYTPVCKNAICLNFSLPYYSVTDRINGSSVFNMSNSYMVTYGVSAFLKWPGDYVRLRAIKVGDVNKWLIIENKRVDDLFFPLYKLDSSPGFWHARGKRWDMGPKSKIDPPLYEPSLDVAGGLFLNNQYESALYNLSLNPYKIYEKLSLESGDPDYWGVSNTVAMVSRDTLMFDLTMISEVSGEASTDWMSVNSSDGWERSSRAVFDGALPTPDPGMWGVNCVVTAQSLKNNRSLVVKPIGVGYEPGYSPLESYNSRFRVSFISQNPTMIGAVYFKVMLGGPYKSMANYVFHNVEFNPE